MDTGVQTTMQVIGGKWKAGTLMRLKAGPTRFNTLKRALPGVTQRMLAQQLRELEADGIVSRHVLEIVPPHVEYALTPKGATLMPILNWLSEWGHAHAPAAPNPEPTQRKAKPAPDLNEPKGWRFDSIDVQRGGLTHGQIAGSQAHLAFAAVDLSMA